MFNGRANKIDASSGRSGPRGNDDANHCGKVGRAPVGGRVTLVAVSSNCLRFVWPHRSARRNKFEEFNWFSKPRSGWRAVGSGLRLAAPASAASGRVERALGVKRRAWLAGGRTFGAHSWPCGLDRFVCHHG